MYPMLALSVFGRGDVIIIPLAILAAIVALLLVVKAAASRYITVGPNEIAIFFGRKYKFRTEDGQIGERGFHVLMGGGKLLLPIVEKVKIINVSAFQVEVREENIPAKNNVGVNISGIATCRISLKPEDLSNAVANFLDRSLEDTIMFNREILKGHIRSIIGKLEINELLRERQKFNEQVIAESAEEFKRLGIEIVNLVIQDVRDNHGVIEALGRQSIAGTKRDADIAVAEAERETKIKTSNAEREAAQVKADNEAKIAEATRQVDLRKAENKRLVDTENAKATAATQLAKAEQDKQIAILEAERDKAKADAQVGVQEKEKMRKQKELEATVLTQAEAESKSNLIKAENAQKVAELDAKRLEIEANGRRAAAIKTGEGEAEKIKLTAGAQAEATRWTRSAEAEGAQKVQLAEAEGQKAKLLAEAEGERAKLLAHAEGKQKSLLAEAEGTEKLAEALAKLSEQGKIILILDRLPGLIEKAGDAGSKVAREVFTPIGMPLSNIKSIQITDLGGGNAAKNGVRNLGTVVPEILMDFFAQAKARGIDMSALAKLIKVDSEGLMNMLGNLTADGTPRTDGVTPTAAAPTAKESSGPIIEKSV